MQIDDIDGFQSNEELEIEEHKPEEQLINHYIRSNTDEFKDKLPSAREISTVKYSLAPDMITGWIPKRSIACPVPLNFENPVIDFLIKQLTNNKYQQVVAYLGYRPHNTYKVHNSYSPNNYNFKYGSLQSENSPQMINFFRFFYDCFQVHTIKKFEGMNPQLSHDLFFDSKFQSGNLDAVVQVSDRQYDLFIRIDSNTIGHCLWYYFKTKPYKKQKIKFNLTNLKNTITLYNDGNMFPYCYSKKLNQLYGLGWHQLSNSNCICTYKTLRYPFLKTKFPKGAITYFNLSFQYKYQYIDDQVFFAYCIPYSYSSLVKMIGQIKEEAIEKNYEHIKISKLGQSLSGIDIPLLTFGTKDQEEKKKKCIVIQARIHPGQTNSSWMVERIIKELTNYKKYACLFEQATFKIVPMINPDGVILGNLRSSCSGKDLNRRFFQQKNILFPQIRAMKQHVEKLKDTYGDNMLMFLDLHGHSSKKNVFLYGIDSIIKNLEGRMFPKLISQKTQIFRYYSCNFKLKNDKKTTGRACFIKYFKNCYTIQASLSCYFIRNSQSMYFTQEEWLQFGYNLLQAIQQYIDIMTHKQIKSSKTIFKNYLKPRAYRRKKKQNKKIQTQDIYKTFGLGIFNKYPQQTQYSAFEKYVQLFNMIKDDTDNNFQQAEQTDSEKEDYKPEKGKDFQQQLFIAKQLFEKAYRKTNGKALNMQYNYYYEKRFNRDNTSGMSRKQNDKTIEQRNHIRRFSEASYNKIQKQPPKGRPFNFDKRMENRRRLYTAGFEKKPQSPMQQKRFFEQSYQLSNKSPEKVPYKTQTFNLRLLAPQNYIKPYEPPKKKSYIGKKQLSKITPSQPWTPNRHLSHSLY